jgi:guanylate kinase
MNEGVLMVVSGPSGAGKGTVVGELVRRSDDVFLSVSVTTRSPRPGEIPDRHYFFVSPGKFRAMIDNNELLEFAEYAGHFYGTPAAEVDRKLSEGKNVILEIDIRGGYQIRKARKDVVLVFLVPPTLAELERRLRKRGTESEESIRKRLAIAANEFRNIRDYDYIVVNDTVDNAVARLQAILIAERCSTKRISLDELLPITKRIDNLDK